jgi:hypothetical protein
VSEGSAEGMGQSQAGEGRRRLAVLDVRWLGWGFLVLRESMAVTGHAERIEMVAAATTPTAIHYIGAGQVAWR